MTTICWDGRYLAADRRHRTGEQWHFEGCKFITSERAGVWYTSTGTSAVVEAWAAWADAGADPYGMLPRNDLEGYQGGLIRLSGDGVHMLDYRVPYWTWAGNSWAWGSGADFALAAMACGKNAMEAVDVAAKLDPATGDGVDFIDHGEPVLGVQRWGGLTPYVHGGTASWAVPSPGGVMSGEPTAYPFKVPDPFPGGNAMFERLRAAPFPTEYPQSSTMSTEELNRAFNPGLIAAVADPTPTTERATVERWCERWNAASKSDNKPLMSKLETELRSVKFPDGVALEWHRDSDYPHGRQTVVTVVDAPKAE